jgi:hypothetical protein
MTSYPTPDFSPTTLSDSHSKGAERSERLRKALEHAVHGWPVFPCVPCGKEPLTWHGHLDATTDRSRITAWWNRWPGANIGVPTGGRSGVLALDVDPDKGGEESLTLLEDSHGALPETRTHSTGSGGRHYLFKYPEGSGIRNSTSKLAEGLDVRAEGGYIIVPPSHTTQAYEVLDALPLATPPEWLTEILTEILTEPKRASEAGQARNIATAISVGACGPPIPQARETTPTPE